MRPVKNNKDVAGEKIILSFFFSGSYLPTKWNWNVKIKYSGLLPGVVGVVQTHLNLDVCFIFVNF